MSPLMPRYAISFAIRRAINRRSAMASSSNMVHKSRKKAAHSSLPRSSSTASYSASSRFSRSFLFVIVLRILGMYHCINTVIHSLTSGGKAVKRGEASSAIFLMAFENVCECFGQCRGSARVKCACLGGQIAVQECFKRHAAFFLKVFHDVGGGNGSQVAGCSVRSLCGRSDETHHSAVPVGYRAARGALLSNNRASDRKHIRGVCVEGIDLSYSCDRRSGVEIFRNGNAAQEPRRISRNQHLGALFWRVNGKWKIGEGVGEGNAGRDSARDTQKGVIMLAVSGRKLVVYLLCVVFYPRGREE